MTNITEEKQRLLKQYAQKWCKIKDPSKCTKTPCTCSLAAEFRAFINITIPSGFQDFTIKDFGGRLKNGFDLHPSVAAEAKRKLFKYCWGKVELLDRLSIMSESDLDKASVISNRVKLGHNIVIHGDPLRRMSDASDGKTRILKTLPLGKTFMAAIATKEVIKLRVDPKHPEYSMSNYEWIEYSALYSAISDYDSRETANMEMCDWLVVDNIPESLMASSLAQKSYVIRFLDPFMYKRIKFKLPTVLVFRFDIEKRRTEIENSFGLSIMKIIDDPNTCVISLTQPRQGEEE
jgi:hypothetical protein